MSDWATLWRNKAWSSINKARIGLLVVSVKDVSPFYLILYRPQLDCKAASGGFGDITQSAAVGGGIGAAACCVTFTVCPATAIDAARVVVPGLDAIVKVTLPLPVPVVPPVSTTHAASDCALHGQPATAVTVILPVPPVAGTLCSVAESSNVQGAAS